MELPYSATFWFENRNNIEDELEVRVETFGGDLALILKTDKWEIDPEKIDEFADQLKWCLRQVKPKLHSRKVAE